MSIKLCGFALLSILFGTAIAAPAYIPPRAADAPASPAKFPEEIKEAKLEAERTRYSVMIGMRDFEGLEKEANVIISGYADNKISGDEFFERLYAMVPFVAGKTYIQHLNDWVKARPKSYAARYVLGRQYLDLAQKGRGSGWARDTSNDKFEEMNTYGVLARDTLLQSLALHPRPVPSYRGLIAAENFTTANGKQKLRCTPQETVIVVFLRELCSNPDKLVQARYLLAAIKADPDATNAYDVYFTYNSARWGGSNGLLEYFVNEARRAGEMSRPNLAKIDGGRLSRKAEDMADLDKRPAQAAEIFVPAFDTSPLPEHVIWLYYATQSAKEAHNFDYAIRIYDKIIANRPGEYRAYYERGLIYRQERKDIPRYLADQIEAAKLGYRYPQNNVGYYYMTGEDGFPVNLEEAKAWLTMAANQGFQHSKDKLPLVEAMLAKQRAETAARK